MAKSKRDTSAEQSHIIKKCPECYTYIPLDAVKCPSCKVRIGRVDKHGMAIRNTNWGSYIICILAWVVFVIYIWFAFFRA